MSPLQVYVLSSLMHIFNIYHLENFLHQAKSTGSSSHPWKKVVSPMWAMSVLKDRGLGRSWTLAFAVLIKGLFCMRFFMLLVRYHLKLSLSLRFIFQEPLMNKTEVIGTLMLKSISTISRKAKLKIFKRRVQALTHEAPHTTMPGKISIIILNKIFVEGLK